MQLMDKIERANEKVTNFNERELIFKQPLSEYSDLAKLLQEFLPYHQLWELAMDFDLEYQEWMNGPFMKSLSYPVIEKKVNQHFYRETARLQKFFGEIDDKNAGDIATDLRSQIEKFRENLWLIELLTTEAMSNAKRSAPHWKELFKECQIKDIEPNDEMTLQRLLEAGIAEHRVIIEDVSRKAEKQWSIEKKLKEMEDKVKA
jgi:dynein heavy chain